MNEENFFIESLPLWRRFLYTNKVFVPFGINERLPSDSQIWMSEREEKIESFSPMYKKIHKQVIFCWEEKVQEQNPLTIHTKYFNFCVQGFQKNYFNFININMMQISL